MSGQKFFASASADVFGFTNTGDKVTASASATANSDISYEDALKIATEIAYNVANSELKSNIDLIQQTITIAKNEHTGPTGPTGPAGPTGAQGPVGPTGPESDLGGDIEFSLSNIQLDFSNNIVNETYTLPKSGRWYNCSMSSDSKYQMAIQSNNAIYNSSDYGITWEEVTTLNNDGFVSCSMSNDGKYRIVASIDYSVTISSDYGVTWNKVDILNLDETNVGISGDGKYMTFVTLTNGGKTGGKVWRSSDYGATWSDVTPTFTEHPGYYFCVAISQDGKYQTLTITAYYNYLSSIVISNDYGITWNLIPLGNNICSNAMSYDGKYQIAGDFGTSDTPNTDGIYTSSDYGSTWKSVKVDVGEWLDGAVSDDGKYQIYIGITLPYICASNDYGNTWSNINFDGTLRGVAMSANGQNLTIAPRNLKLYNSTDYGITWSDNNNSSSSKSIVSISCSSSGQYQTAAISGDYILKSSDYGKTWNNTKSKQDYWTSISMSLTGQYQSAISFNNLSISSDFGNTWKDTTITNKNHVIAVSSSGQYQTYVSQPGYIYISNDYGNTWNEVNISINSNALAMSSTGKYQYTADYYLGTSNTGYIYVSNNYGKDWKKATSTLEKSWNSIACSSNGKYVLAGSIGSTPSYGISSDYGNTWNIFSNDINCYDCNVSSTGQYQIFSDVQNRKNYYSIDYGNTFSVLTDNDPYHIGCISSTARNQVYYRSNGILEVETLPYGSVFAKKLSLFEFANTFKKLNDIQLVAPPSEKSPYFYNIQSNEATGQYSNITLTANGVNSSVNSIAFNYGFSGPELYLGGNFTNVVGETSVDGLNYIGRVQPGGYYNPLNNGLNASVNYVVYDSNNSTFFNRIYYACGFFTDVSGVDFENGTFKGIAKWSDYNWSALGSGFSRAGYIPHGNVIKFDPTDPSGNILYVGGAFDTAGDVSANNIAKWDGTTWSALDSGVTNSLESSYITDIAFDASNNLYVVGNFDTAGDVSANNVAKWDGTTWSALGSGITGFVDSYIANVSSLAFDAHNNLYVGGNFNTAGDISANYIAKWDGTTWSALGSGVTNFGDFYNGEVSSLIFDSSNNLYVGGYFDTAGDVSANSIAKWDGTTWSTLGSGVTIESNYITYPARIYTLEIIDNYLYIGGQFNNAGGVSVSNIAKLELNFENYVKNTDSSKLYLNYSGKGSITNLLDYDYINKKYSQVN